ncbi:hypothetical protein T11_10860 [Trichinella zimbabwensis]|uniref:Uncharacterized protein n=1 Tax=Trichinella zimbabwensis TaxID=268475 RepID=A0A0V1GCF4_9BILA|nr:hypothetical protein T11_10860 [Trichinella zimbabwensis]
MSFLALFRGEPSTICGITGRLSQKLYEMLFVALFMVNEARFG